MRFCRNEVYEKIRDIPFARVAGNWSQENVKIFGFTVAVSQPDMISEGMNPPDMCWAVWPFYKL